MRFPAFSAVLACSLAGILGCSESSSNNVAGNSAETGSPELASISGELYLEGGKPAALARVICISSQFDVEQDSVLYSARTDSSGHFEIKDVKVGSYSMEAVDKESGWRLLIQNVEMTEGTDEISVDDTLKAPGVALLKVDSLKGGTEGVVTALGTTIYREVVVREGTILVDSLPEGRLNLQLELFDETTLRFDKVKVESCDTVKVGFAESAADTLAADTSKVDTLVMRFIAPLALPEGAVDSLVGYVSDIPLALRLTPENCNFDTLAGMDGRWFVRRIKTDGGTSKELPIASGYFDSLAQEAVFWVNVDSLNFDDSLELTFDNTLTSGFALDVFPTNRSYTAVWHFDDGLTPVTDAAEKKNFPGAATGVKLVDGVVGSGVALASESFIVAENSAVADTNFHGNLAAEGADYLAFSLWVRLDSADSAQVIFEKGDKEYGLYFDPEEGFVVNVYAAATGSDADTISYKLTWKSGVEGLTANQWNYVAFSKQAFKDGRGNSTLFINDKKISSYTKAEWDGERKAASDFKIGGFVGAIDEFFMGSSFRIDSWTYLTYLNQKPEGFWPQF